MLQNLKEYQQNYLRVLNTNYKRYIHQIVDFNQKLIGIIGARGVGKTTFLLQYLKEHDLPLSKKLYMSADAIDLDSLFEIAFEFSKEGGELLIIDEIHKYKNFEIELKKIYDMLSIKVIFSGSSAIKLDHSKGDLSRRALLYHMKGLSFREFIELKKSIKLPTFSTEEIFRNHVDIAYELGNDFKPFEFFQEYLKYGYYPFYFENEQSYLLKLQETINTVIEVDIPSIFPIEYDKIINLKKLVRLVCQSKPFKINIKELSTKIGINDYQTLYKYLEYLKRGKILNLLRAKTKGDSIFVKPDKIYLANTNLHYSYCDQVEIGTIREVFFMSMFDEKDLTLPSKGDFSIEDTYIVEVGGKTKSYNQIKEMPKSYIVSDDIEIGSGNKIPLWLFGFLY
ncbi:MAG: AAA family ATPase [Thiovulaceae bacterium]|uniref:ATP-binding protein n=1 Tax=Sulfurimonas sp. TaxID=2022749 RepID=UPI00260867A5|nr:AAA family ATPase [Sulfurimonas sp.]MDD2653480.1 AAA family ATPase [Sulfurimonas sp.]MDD3817122.1 AAA family ATPase [Sulfurimonadaceae bacterium]